jgi:polysaccharide biosynthesis/export protein
MNYPRAPHMQCDGKPKCFDDCGVRDMTQKRIAATLEVSIVVTMVVALCAAQQGPQKTAVPGDASTRSASPAGPVSDKPSPAFGSERNPRYELRADDVLDISFEFNPEFNQTVTVQPDGYLSLRGVGDVHAAGLTVPKLTETIRVVYEKILANPSVTVLLKEFERPFFIVNGQVGKPGKYELRGNTTVTEAIAMAGGLTSAAKHSQVVLYRRVSPDWYEGRLINIKKMLHSRDLIEDRLLKPGDMLWVPQNKLSKVRQFLPTPNVGAGTTF